MFFFLAAVLGLACANVVIESSHKIYDSTSRLKIKGPGLDATSLSLLSNTHEPKINIKLSIGSSTLVDEKDFVVSSDEDGLILKLNPGKKWFKFEDGRDKPLPLTLTSLKLNEIESEVVAPIPVAHVLPTPQIKRNKRKVLQSKTPELTIKGDFLTGTQELKLFFYPHIYPDLDYVFQSSFPLLDNEVVLKLAAGKKWSRELGPLYLVGINTGGGTVSLKTAENMFGILVAEVVDDSLTLTEEVDNVIDAKSNLETFSSKDKKIGLNDLDSEIEGVKSKLYRAEEKKNDELIIAYTKLLTALIEKQNLVVKNNQQAPKTEGTVKTEEGAIELMSPPKTEEGVVELMSPPKTEEAIELMSPPKTEGVVELMSPPKTEEGVVELMSPPKTEGVVELMSPPKTEGAIELMSPPKTEGVVELMSPEKNANEEPVAFEDNGTKHLRRVK